MKALIGRDHELKTLKQALESAAQNIGCCWMLAGEAGIGKSRLVEELKLRAATENFRIVKGNCFQQDAAFPYAPWIDALRISFASLSAAEIGQTLGPLTSEFNKLLPELRLLIPDVLPNPPLEPAAEKYRSFESLSRFLLSADAPRPSLIILEDLHWSDSLSLELLHFLARRIMHLPVLLIGTYRAEDSSPHLERLLSELNRERLAQEIALGPFGRNEIDQLARQLLNGEHRIPAWLVDALLTLTDGNPFFVEEVLQDLADEGRIDKLLQQTALTELPVPRSIQRMVQQRVEQLPESSRQVLIHASVIGERFDFGLLQDMTGRSEHDLLDALKGLMDTRLVAPESANQFVFRHALTRQAVYSMLIPRERSAMHRAIGETLERLGASRTDAAATQLAYHFYQAGVWQKAMEYSQRAGEQALALYAPREAFAHFTHALDAAHHLAPPADIEVQLHRGRAQAREVWGEFDGARADYEAALDLARHGTSRVDEWQTLIDLGLLFQSRDLERAGEIFQRALALARQLDDPSMLAGSLNRVGNWHTNCGHGRDALPLHREALELFHKLGDRHGMARTMELLGLVNYQLCDLVQGAAYMEQAVPILRELDDRQALVHALTGLSWRPFLVTEVLGDTRLVDLAGLSEEALQIARGFNWYQGELLALMQGAICLKQAGEYWQALDQLARAEWMLEEGRNRDASARLHAILGEISMELLAFSEAQQRFETSLEIARDMGSELLMASAKTRLAAVAVRQGDFARAHALLTGLLPAEYPNGQELAPQRGCWVIYAELELARGNPDRSLEIMDRMIASTVNLEQYGLHAVPRLSQLRGQALAALGRLAEAEAELQGTLPIAIRQGQRPIVWRLHVDLGRVHRLLGRRQDAEHDFDLARALLQELVKAIPEGALRDNFLQRALAMLPPAHVPTPRQATKQEFGGLTAREREIAALVAQAKSNREIADELVISEKTTERHIANILIKLGFSSRTQIAVWAVEKGLRK